MYQTVNETDFHEAFRNCDRINQFSYEARNLLFEYLEQYEEETGEKIELDVIVLCCEYYESDADEIIQSYSIDVEEDADDDAKAEAVRDYLNENTTLVGETAGSFVYAAF